MSLQYPKDQIAFQKIPKPLLKACTDPRYASGWVFAKVKRPQGNYLLLYGPVWVAPDKPGTPKLRLEYATNGAIALIKPTGECQQLWDADNAFNNFFPGNLHDLPTHAEGLLIHDLAADLIRRAELALGGKQQFLYALDATGHSDSQQDAVMVPLLEELRRPGSRRP
jgi:hypothetical protein